MKPIYFLSLYLFLSACSASSKYEQAIADFVQTDKRGTKYDLKFQVLELKELTKVSVSDSLIFLKEKWEKDKANKLTFHHQNMESTKISLEKETASKYPSKNMTDLYTRSITRDKQAIDSLSTWVPNQIKVYENKKQNEILAIVVECKYRAVIPTTTTEYEETREFTLNSDGTKCLRQSAPKK